MNYSPDEKPESAIYCPSCAARIEEAVPPGAVARCPVCGTEFKYEPQATSQNEIEPAERIISKSTPRRSTEETLLERLKSEPPEKKPVRWQSAAIIFLAILSISYGVFWIASKPNTYAPGHEVDSTALLQKRSFYQHIIDSLQTEIAQNPGNVDLHLSLADALYDGAYWSASLRQFEIYLAAKPADADARVDYAYTIAQNNGDLNQALSEIDTALRYDPNHLNALINAGIITAQTVTDTNHTTALARARNYFERAKTVAQKTNPEVALRIDTLIQEIDKTGSRMSLR